jgi:hypothetical protein
MAKKKNNSIKVTELNSQKVAEKVEVAEVDVIVEVQVGVYVKVQL